MSNVDLYQNPQVMEAIRYYTDPLLPTWNNKSASAAAAGLKSTSCFQRAEVKEEIERIVAERVEAGKKVVEFLGTYSMDAARELVRQLSAGRELEFIDIEGIMGEDSFNPDALSAVVRHNKTVIDTIRERRAAAIEIIRQQIGTPEQRIKVKREGNEPTMLDDMDDEKLQQLNEMIAEELESRQPKLLEAEVVSESATSSDS
jgi:hypothetical protein